MSEIKTLRLLLSIGVIASIIVGAGEYMLHYLPSGPDGEMSMLDSVPLARASKGHFLVVFGAPLYMGAYYGLMRTFRPSSPKLSIGLLVAGVFSFMVGGVWVGSRYFAAIELDLSISN